MTAAVRLAVNQHVADPTLVEPQNGARHGKAAGERVVGHRIGGQWHSRDCVGDPQSVGDAAVLHERSPRSDQLRGPKSLRGPQKVFSQYYLP